MRSRVEEFAEIRRIARTEGLSINALAKRFGVHRRTIQQALASAQPPARKAPERAAPKLDAVRELIDDMLRGLSQVQRAETDYGEPIPFDVEAARSFAQVAVDIRRSGRKPAVRAFDALIAATAKAAGLPLYTFNADDLRGVTGLEIVALPPERGA